MEGERHIPFLITRVYYRYDVPGGESRGGHAHRKMEQFIISANGSFDVIIHDGFERTKFYLNRSYYGLYIPPMTWRELENFSTGSVCLVLASEYFDQDDYLRDFSEFIEERRRIKKMR